MRWSLAALCIPCCLSCVSIAVADLAGDFDGNGSITPRDTILGLHVLSGRFIDVEQVGDSNGNNQTDMGDILFSLQHRTCGSNALYVAPNGSASGSGAFGDPLDGLRSATAKIRAIKQETGIPAGGITVCFRAGVYPTDPVIFTVEDSGEIDSPIIYRNYPDETVVLSGGLSLEAGWFTTVDSDDPLLFRLNSEVIADLKVIDLRSYGITDFGSLTRRGYSADHRTSALELAINGEIMRLARWPNLDQTDPDDTNAPARITGNLTPDITGTFEYIGTEAMERADDGYPNYRRQGLVDGVQYYLYHCALNDGATPYWFISGHDPRNKPNCWPAEGRTDYPSWAKHTGEMTAVLHPFNNTDGYARFTSFPEDYSRKGYVRIPEVVSENSFRVPGDRINRWAEDADIWVTGLFGNYWADDTLPASINGDTLVLEENTSYGLNTNMPFFVFNLPEELDEPGEYYLDRDSGRLYVYPPSFFSNIQVSIAPAPLISGTGLANVQFVGMTLELSRSRLVDLDNAGNITFDTMVFRNNGGLAINLQGTKNSIQRSSVFGNGSGGIVIEGGNRSTLTPGENEAVNNDIHHYARLDITYKPGVKVAGAGNRVANNHIHDAPHFGVQFYGNDHLIELNRIERVTTETHDAGAIYGGRDWGYRGNVIRYNLFKDIDSIYGQSHGVYLDDGTSGVTVTGNIFYTVNGFAVKSGGGRDNIITNNIIVNAALGALTTDRRVRVKINNNYYSNGKPNSWNLLGRLKTDYYNYRIGAGEIRYQVAPWSNAYPEAAIIPNDYEQMVGEGHWLEPEGCVFANNISWRTSNLMVNGTWGGENGTDYFASTSPNLDNVDPMFVDESTEDLNLSPDSPVFTSLDFTAIPFDQIGRK